MKKLFTLFAVAALTATMAACGGNANQQNNDEAATEVEAAAPAAAAEGDVLDKYEALINKAIEVYGKVKQGDAGAMEEYAKIAEEMSAMSTELTTAVEGMSAAQAQRFAELGQKWAAAAAQ